MRGAARFKSGSAISCKLNNAPLAKRIAAAKELIYILDGQADIDATGAFEDGLIVVEVHLAGTDKWEIDYHIAWPEPQLNNQHLSVIKLINWTASPLKGPSDPVSAADARRTANTRLRQLISSACREGGELNGRVTLIASEE